MIKKAFFYFLIFSTQICFSQTIEKEKEFINTQIKSGLIPQTELKDRFTNFTALVKEFGYPKNFVADTIVGSLSYKTSISYSLPDSEVFERVKQWAALTYGDIDSVIKYENKERGVLVYKGLSKIFTTNKESFFLFQTDIVKSYNLYHTVLIICKQGKLSITINNLDFETRYGGEIIGSTYIPITYVHQNLDNLFPITAAKQNLWSERFKLVNLCEKEVIDYSNRMILYIKQ